MPYTFAREEGYVIAFDIVTTRNKRKKIRDAKSMLTPQYPLHRQQRSNPAMADLDDVEAAIDRVESAIKRLEKSLKDIVSWPNLAFWAFCFFAAFEWFGSAIHSKYRYEIQYGMGSSDIHIGRKPHDCDFLAAPVGAKFCRYDVSVLDEEVRASQQPGSFLVSQDGGKTWRPTELTKPYHGVWINWNKVDE